MALTERKVRELKEKGRYGDGHGLYLQVMSATNRSWLLRYEINKRERYMGLGSATDFTLKEARERARKQRQLLADGIDPIEKRLSEQDAERRKEAERITFKEAAEQFIALHEAGWRNAKHQKQWQTTLKKYVYPTLGPRPIKAIDAALINQTLAPIWQTIPDTASRIKQRVERVITWVKAGKPLPAPAAEHHGRNHAALKYQELPSFMIELRERQGISAKALQFCILNASRSNEVIGARWSEINLEEKVWTIPGPRMKAGREHRVPLSDAAIELLQGLPTETDNPFVFIGSTRGGRLNPTALLQALRLIRDDATVHGFRATFKTWASERSNFPREVVEMSLAHAVGNAVEAAYQRSTLFDKRRKLMELWAEFCTQPEHVATGSNVTALRAS
jgi:integrase